MIGGSDRGDLIGRSNGGDTRWRAQLLARRPLQLRAQRPPCGYLQLPALQFVVLLLLVLAGSLHAALLVACAHLIPQVAQPLIALALRKRGLGVRHRLMHACE